MDIMTALKTRRSVRNFKEKDVEEEKIMEMIDVARLAPSGNNLQPVEYIIVKDSERRKRLSQIAAYGDFIKMAPLCIVVISKITEHDIEDGSAATENILLAAHGQGLSSCWVAGYKKSYSSEVEVFLNIPDDYRLISILPIGYSDSSPEPINKRKISDVLHEESF